MARIHIVLSQEDKARYAAQAAREGKSLGAWLREAAEEQLKRAEGTARLDTVEALQAFFAECDARETACEPDWEEQHALIQRSRVHGLEVT